MLFFGRNPVLKVLEPLCTGFEQLFLRRLYRLILSWIRLWKFQTISKNWPGCLPVATYSQGAAAMRVFTSCTWIAACLETICIWAVVKQAAIKKTKRRALFGKEIYRSQTQVHVLLSLLNFLLIAQSNEILMKTQVNHASLFFESFPVLLFRSAQPFYAGCYLDMLQ